MKSISILCGSAAILLLMRGALAADLTVAEPVDYAKVCDAFGTGFSYSPGTDTCIKVGGYVKFGTSFGHSDFGDYIETYPNSRWSNFYTEVSIQLTASSKTEYGDLTGFIDMRALTDNEGGFTESLTEAVNSTTKTAYLDSAYLSLGPVKAGYFTSLFDFGLGYTDTGSFGSDATTDHVELTYAIGSFGLAVSVEDQRDRGAAGNEPLTAATTLDGRYEIAPGVVVPVVTTTFAEGGSDNVPDIVAAVTYSSGIVSVKAAAAAVNQAMNRSGSGTLADPLVYSGAPGWAVGGNVEVALDKIAAGDKFFVAAAYGDNANSFTGIAGDTSVASLEGFEGLGLAEVAPGTSWSGLASYKHVWSPSVWSALTGGYAEYDGADWYAGDSLSAWRLAASTSWTPVGGLELMLDGSYSSVDGDGAVGDGDAWAVNLWLERSW